MLGVFMGPPLIRSRISQAAFYSIGIPSHDFTEEVGTPHELNLR